MDTSACLAWQTVAARSDDRPVARDSVVSGYDQLCQFVEIRIVTDICQVSLAEDPFENPRHIYIYKRLALTVHNKRILLAMYWLIPGSLSSSSRETGNRPCFFAMTDANATIVLALLLHRPMG